MMKVGQACTEAKDGFDCSKAFDGHLGTSYWPKKNKGPPYMLSIQLNEPTKISWIEVAFDRHDCEETDDYDFRVLVRESRKAASIRWFEYKPTTDCSKGEPYTK